MGWKGVDVISIMDFKKEELELLFNAADLDAEDSKPLDGKVVATAFYEPSTRTRLSFDSAVKRLGGSTIDLNPGASSIAKGEDFLDTMKMLDSYADLIILRSPSEGAARLAAEICEHPVINAGDGSQHHPTQAMIDLYSLKKMKGSIGGLSIGIMGDLKYGRAANSFLFGLGVFGVKEIKAIAHPSLRIKDVNSLLLNEMGMHISYYEELEEVLEELDVIYITRVQKERFSDPAEYEKLKDAYKLDLKALAKAKPGLLVMHPLPRLNEISREVDSTQHAAYFKQAAYGVKVRMALIRLVLGE
ncbi:MAG: aspartate carbamoyltransferase [Candidatus Micrarchaeia archaeon]